MSVLANDDAGNFEKLHVNVVSGNVPCSRSASDGQHTMMHESAHMRRPLKYFA